MRMLTMRTDQLLWTGVLLASLVLIAVGLFGRPARGEPYRVGGDQQVTIRNSSGQTTGTATTNSNGITTFRDAGGRTTGTATRDSSGTTTLRDASGRTTGTVSGPRR